MGGEALVSPGRSFSASFAAVAGAAAATENLLGVLPCSQVGSCPQLHQPHRRLCLQCHRPLAFLLRAAGPRTWRKIPVSRRTLQHQNLARFRPRRPGRLPTPRSSGLMPPRPPRLLLLCPQHPLQRCCLLAPVAASHLRDAALAVSAGRMAPRQVAAAVSTCPTAYARAEGGPAGEP